MKRFCTIAVPLGLAAYAVAFLLSPLPSICDQAGRPLLRLELLGQLILLPDKAYFPNWFGSPAEFSVFDRLPIFGAAAAIVGWAATLGHLVMVVWRHFAGPGLRLDRLEWATFSVAIGLNLISTWTLFWGLFGAMGPVWVFWIPAGLTLGAVLVRQFALTSQMKVTGLSIRWLGTVFVRQSALTPGPSPKGRGETMTIAPHQTPNARGELSTITPCPLPKGRGETMTIAPHQTPKARGEISPAPTILSTRWLWAAAPFVVIILLAAAVPPLDFDVREYHLQAPKEFFEQGRITFLPHNVYANMAMGTEMLSLLGMILIGQWWLGALVGKVVISVYTILTMLALYAAGRRFYSQSVGVVAALAFVSIPWVVSIASGGFVEGGSACYLFLAVYAVWLDAEQNSVSRRACWALAGWMTGAAIATKYPAALFVFVPIVGWLMGLEIWRWWMRDEKACRQPSPPTPLPKSEGSRSTSPTASFSQLGEGKYIFQLLAVFLLAVAVGCGAWFGKNWVLTGNPTYPLLYGTLGGTTWTAAKDRQWNQVHRPHDFSPKTLIHDVGRVVLTSEWLSPIVVPLAVLAFLGFGPRRRTRWVFLAYIGFVVGAWWLLTHRIDRFWIPILPVVALLAGIGACWCDRRWWRWTLAGFLGAGLALNFLVASAGQGNAWFVALDKLRSNPAWADPWHQYFNTHPPEGRLLLVGDAAPFDLNGPVLYNTCFDDCIFEQIAKGRSASQIRSELANRQITHVCVNWAEINRYRATYGFTDFIQPEVFDRLVADGVLEPLPMLEGSSTAAYRVR